MTRSAGRTFLLWLLAMLAGAAVVWNSRFSADISFFLPARPSAEQQVLVDQLKEGAVSRLLMLAVEGGDATQRAELSRALRDRLAALPEFVTAQNGDAGSQDAERDFLLKHRYLLSPSVTPERFSEAGLQAAVANSIDLLASPAGLLLKPLLTRDPTGEMVELLGGLNAGAEPASRAGVWASRDGERALLLVQTRALGSDTDGQEKAIALIRQQFAAVAQRAGLGNLKLQLSGPGLFAVKARATIKSEVTRLSLISLTAIVAVLLFVYRSPRLLLLSLLPVASGALAGIVAVSLAYGTVFGITVGFGSALIGEAVDYAIYFLVQSGKLGVDGWRQRYWPTIRLGVLTSVCGFGALLFSGFPGLAQLGLYTLAGVLTAALVTRFVLPPLAGSGFHVRVPQRAGNALGAALRHAPALRWPAIVLALAATGYLVAQRDALWLPNLSALSTTSAEDAALDARLRADLGAPDSRYLAVVTAPDREAALAAAERAGQRLDRLVADGVIGGYDSPARFLPSAATQAARRASLPPAAELRPRLQAALVDSPLSAAKLEPFLADVEAARRQPLIDRHDLDGTGLALAVDSLLLHGPSGWSVLLPLRPAGGEQGVDLPLDAVRTALAGSGALFLDMKGEFDALYGNYLSEAAWLSAAGFAAIAALLAFALRSPRRLAGVLMPLMLAVALVIAGLHLAGERLHLLHLVGMLLIVAVGSNYALFFDRIAAGATLDAGTLMSMAVAATTTVIGFGTLALSSVPVLHAIGVTVGPGVLLALLLSAVFASRERAR
jgi:predicted exporter